MVSALTVGGTMLINFYHATACGAILVFQVVACSYAYATRNRISSENGAPPSCSPIGKLSLVKPPGIEIAGRAVRA